MEEEDMQTLCLHTFVDQSSIKWHRESIFIDMAVMFVRACCAREVVNEDKVTIDDTCRVHRFNIQCPLRTPQYRRTIVPFI